MYFQLDADILNGGNTEEQIRETFFEVILKKKISEKKSHSIGLVFIAIIIDKRSERFGHFSICLQVYKLFDDFGIIDKNKYMNINNEIKV